MERLVTISPGSKTKKFITKNEDRTCEVEIKHEGIFNGFIERIYSSGKYDIRLTGKVEK
jgi:hypothetical protein